MLQYSVNAGYAVLPPCRSECAGVAQLKYSKYIFRSQMPFPAHKLYNSLYNSLISPAISHDKEEHLALERR